MQGIHRMSGGDISSHKKMWRDKNYRGIWYSDSCEQIIYQDSQLIVTHTRELFRTTYGNAKWADCSIQLWVTITRCLHVLHFYSDTTCTERRIIVQAWLLPKDDDPTEWLPQMTASWYVLEQHVVSAIPCPCALAMCRSWQKQRSISVFGTYTVSISTLIIFHFHHHHQLFPSHHHLENHEASFHCHRHCSCCCSNNQL